MYDLLIFMAPKTLIISLVYYPEFVGGAEVATFEITKRMPNDSFDMITLRGDSSFSEENIGNVHVYRVGWKVNHTNFFGKVFFNVQKYLFPILVFLNGSSLFQKNSYTHLWSIMANHGGFGALLLKLRFSSLKFVLTLQEGDPISYIKRKVFLVYPLFKMIFKKADTIHVISNYLADFAKSMGGKNIHVIPNGVDLETFSSPASSEEVHRIKQKFNIVEGDVVLVTASRLVIKNGIGDVIKSLLYLPDHYKFLIAGEGELKDSLSRLVSKLGLSARVTFAGFVPHKDLKAFLVAGNIFIRTSLSEGLGNSFLEAMASGLPVVATPVGGIPDFLTDGTTGIFVPQGNPKEIAQGISRLEDISLSVFLKKNANNMVRSRFDWNMIALQFSKLLI